MKTVFYFLMFSKLLGLSIQDTTIITVQDAQIIACDSDYCELIKQFNTSEKIVLIAKKRIY